VFNRSLQLKSEVVDKKDADLKTGIFNGIAIEKNTRRDVFDEFSMQGGAYAL